MDAGAGRGIGKTSPIAEVGGGSGSETMQAALAEQANRAKASANFEGLKLDLETTQAANEVVESLRNTGELPDHYITTDIAKANGWSRGKAVGTSNPGKQIGGDMFENIGEILPSAPGRVWKEADIGINPSVSRSKQAGTRLLYSNDGLLYITTDHYATVVKIGHWK